MVEFSDEEGYGKYLDLHECYEKYINLKGIEVCFFFRNYNELTLFSLLESGLYHIFKHVWSVIWYSERKKDWRIPQLFTDFDWIFKLVCAKNKTSYGFGCWTSNRSECCNDSMGFRHYTWMAGINFFFLYKKIVTDWFLERNRFCFS